MEDVAEGRMKVDIALKVGRKEMATKFDWDGDNDCLNAYIKSLIISLASLQDKKYINKKLLAYRLLEDLKRNLKL